MTAYFEQQPASPQRAGSYLDSLTLRAYNIRTGGQREFLASGPFTITGNVALACTIGGVTNPGADSASIPMSPGGAVNPAPIVRSYANVICNSLSTVQAISVNGAVRLTGAAPSGFSNMINYSATATFAGATTILNTATIPTASGPEIGTSGTTSSSTPTGNMSVTITPQGSIQPLVAGAYADTLRITITPQ